MEFLPMLEQFRTDRGLTEYNKDTFLMMVHQELQEALDADSWNHRVEEMCDVCILAFNALAQRNEIFDPSIKLVYVYKNPGAAVHDATISLMRSGEISEIIQAMRDCITLNGYDFELAMIETCKKILSREGAINQITGKWEKFEFQTDAYKPDLDEAIRILKEQPCKRRS